MNRFIALSIADLEVAWALRKQRRLRSFYINDRPLYLCLLKYFRDNGMHAPKRDRAQYLVDYRAVNKVYIRCRNKYNRSVRREKASREKLMGLLASASTDDLQHALDTRIIT